MKIRVFCITAVCLLAMLVPPTSRGAEYQITNITNNASRVSGVSLNNVGQMAWAEYVEGQTGSFVEIMFFDGTGTHRITHNDWLDDFPRLNDVGQIVWMGELVPHPVGPNYEIFFYDGTVIRQMSSNFNHDTNPDINNAGNLIWEEHERYNAYGYIYYFDGTETHQLVNSVYYTQTAELNDLGQAVWTTRIDGDDKVYFFDGSNIYRLTASDFDEGQASINNNRQIVWSGHDGNDYEIFLFHDGIIEQITDNDYNDYAPRLNELGEVAWTGYVGGSYASAEVFFYDGVQTTQITSNDRPDAARAININGHVAIHSRLATDSNSHEIFVYNGADLIRVTSDDRYELDININDLNQVAWIGYGTNTNQWGHRMPDVFLANRIEEVLIDIKPGSDPNCFNNNGTGVIPVAVLGSADFDAAQIDPASVRLASMQVKATGKSNNLLAALEDSNGDGFVDLVVKIEDEDGVFDIGEASATLTGNLLPEFGATPIKGVDAICVVP